MRRTETAEGRSVLELEPHRQIRLTIYWVVAGLAVIFSGSALFDVAMIFIGPLLGCVLLVSGLWLLGRGFFIAGKLRNRRRSAIAAIVPVGGIATLALLFLPTTRLGGYAQGAGTLLLNQRAYEQTMSNPNSDRLGAKSSGGGRTAIWSFEYGGFLTMDKDIIFDPLGQPEKRAIDELTASAADCRPLWSHYYDCFLDY